MKREQVMYMGMTLIILFLSIGCTSQPPTTEAPDTCGLTEAGVEPAWIVEINGLRTATITSVGYEAAKSHSLHYMTMELEKKGEMHTYQGFPLSQIVAMVDGPDTEHPFVFDEGRWENGYDVTFTASDGYSATFSTAEIGHDVLILADSEDGESIPPQIVGECPRSLWVKDVASIDLSIAGIAEEEEVFRLVFEVNENVTSYTIQELEASPFYIEGTGSYTTSAGSTTTAVWGGVKFADILNRFMALEKEDTVTLVATDGYEMTYSGEQILDSSDGVWILAVKMDGEYLPFDPGYVRTIKVGENNPNIDGHSSVRMIARIVVSGEPYQEFALLIDGRMSFEIDRQTFQSGVSCHTRTVHFERKDVSATYTGIPLWRLLAYADDPDYAPHKQDSSIISYRKEAAEAGYRIELEAADGFTVTLDSREVDENDDLIVAMYKEDEVLPEDEFPLVLVWDKDAAVVPDGAKPIRQITAIHLLFD